MSRQPERLDERRRIETLTARGREILQLLADGLDGPGMAARRYISPRTQLNHVAKHPRQAERALAAAGRDFSGAPRDRGLR